MHSITVKAPAKVNLFLKVLSKRKDSYHSISTLFERIALFDTIKISKAPSGITVKSDIPITKDPRDNLVYKAAKLIFERGKVVSGVKIEINKRIPIASGLGGGSSDAAAVLVGINKLFGLRLSNAILSGMGKKLGADVPFFLLGERFAMGRGRGDELKALRPGRRFWHLIVKAGSKTATEDIYKAFDSEVTGQPKHLTLGRHNDKMLFPSKLRISYAEAESVLYNDLERVTLLRRGFTGRISGDLAQLLGKKAIVSGSGPSLFCLYKTRREAINAKRVLSGYMSKRAIEDWQVFVA